jgi:hypothetical protein
VVNTRINEVRQVPALSSSAITGLVQDFLDRALSVDVPGNILTSDFLYFGSEILFHIPVDDNDSAGQLEPILTRLSNAFGLGSFRYSDSFWRYTLQRKISMKCIIFLINLI